MRKSLKTFLFLLSSLVGDTNGSCVEARIVNVGDLARMTLLRVVRRVDDGL